MTTKYLDANFVFDIEQLSHDMELWQREHGFTDTECNQLIGASSLWNSVKRMNGEYNPSKIGHPSMGTFLKIVNLLGTDARSYFKLDRSLE